MGCALIAGLDEHELAPEGSSSSGTAGSGGGTGGSGTGGSGGGSTWAGQWPDSATPVPCSNGAVGVPCPSKGQLHYGQDGNFELNVPAYQSDSFTVTDPVTQLVWDVEAMPAPDTWSNAVTYCDNLDHAGATDWRLPSRLELLSLLDHGKLDAKLPAVFPAPDPTFPSAYWSSTTEAASSGYAWTVSLGAYGGTWTNSVTDLAAARCVRGTPVAVDQVVAGNMVEDRGTGLVWDRASQAGLSWPEALFYCNSLSDSNHEGHSDWRLPNHKELHTIVDETSTFPAIDTTLFSGDSMGCYWSSTPDSADPNVIFYISFDDGYGDVMVPAGPCSARCVRGF